jgi:hypothetical protein
MHNRGMNNEQTVKTFLDLTAADMIALAAADDMTDNELAARIDRRIGLEARVAAGLSMDARQTQDLINLVEVIDNSLSRITFPVEARS